MATTKYIVNNVSGQTINGQLITPTYKVYTALLTQSGGNSSQSIAWNDPNPTLTIGVTYKIGADNNGDFTNVGAPNNEIDTSFVATGTIPNSWGNVKLEYNTGAPVVTVLENTIGNIWFTYDSAGSYFVNSIGLFTTNKTYVTIQSQPTGGNISDSVNFALIDYESFFGINTVKILTGLISNANSDGMLLNTPIEIRVYN